MLGNGHDVVTEAHVEHAVGFVEDEEGDTREVDVAEREVADETAWGGDEHVGTLLHGTLLLLVADAVVAAIHRHAAYARGVIGKALHGLIDLLREFARRTHDDTVDGILRIAAVVEKTEDGQEVSGCLARTRLGHTNDVAPLQYGRDGVLLYGGALEEIHSIECIEHVVVEV